MPYRAAMNVPAAIPRVPIVNFRSRSIRELRFASRMALTLDGGRYVRSCSRRRERGWVDKGGGLRLTSLPCF